MEMQFIREGQVCGIRVRAGWKGAEYTRESAVLREQLHLAAVSMTSGY